MRPLARNTFLFFIITLQGCSGLARDLRLGFRMSGAAGALVPLAFANRLPGTMSALNLLSVIAPAVPNVPQGPSDEVASGFRALLATLSGEDTAVVATGNPSEPLKPAEGPVEAAGDTPAETPATAVFLAAPTPPPVPLVLPAAEDEPQATTPLPADEDLISKTVSPEVQPREQTTTPVPVDKPAVSKPLRPEVQPPLRDAPVVTAETSDTELTLAQTAAAAEAVEARARTGATPGPLTLPPVAPPPPLRPAADRTARLPGPVDARTAEGSIAKDPARPTPTTLPPAPDVNARPAIATADIIATSVTPDLAANGEAEATGSEPLPTVEGSTAAASTASGARETGLSQLSRATIEATAQIAAQILRRLEGRSTRFEMALTPDELGRVDVKLDIDSEGRLNARLAFDNPAAATDLKGRADELRRQLEDAGFQLADDAFEFTDRDSGSSAFDRGQDTRHGSSRAFAAATRLNAEIDVAQPPRWLALSLSPSGVDMKV